MSQSLNPLEERIAFKAARKQTALAKTWRYNLGYEDALKVRETDPARFDAMSGDYRSKVLGYYLPGREAAKAAGMDITGGNQR